MWKYLKVIIVFIIILLVTTFAVKNNTPVQLNYYFDFPKFDIPLYALIYLPFVVGALFGMIIGISNRIGLRRKTKQLKKELKKLTGEAAKKESPSEEMVPAAMEETAPDILDDTTVKNAPQ